MFDLNRSSPSFLPLLLVLIFCFPLRIVSIPTLLYDILQVHALRRAAFVGSNLRHVFRFVCPWNSGSLQFLV